MNNVIRVLVVDDSPLIREVLCDLLGDAPGLSVVGTARDGHEALAKVVALKPDIITLDVQMPAMDGLETLAAILQIQPTPVIMVSALTQRAADITFQALDRGALDYLPKPEHVSAMAGGFRDELIHKLRTMAGVNVQRLLQIRRQRADRQCLPDTGRAATPLDGLHTSYRDCCVAIGISTGGPPALTTIFQSLAPPLPPIVVVQHMPAMFTGPFARRLDSLSRLSIKEAESGDVLRANQVLLAPGGRHLRLKRLGSQVFVQIADGEPVSGHRPAIDLMMQDVASQFGSRSLGVIMTGMGQDGSAGCAAIRAAKGYVLGQDEASSDVYGMNKVAFTAGHVDKQFALVELPALLPLQCKRRFLLQPNAATNVHLVRPSVAKAT